MKAKELKALIVKLRQGEYNGVDIMKTWLTLETIIISVEKYHRDLTDRKYGGVAQNELVEKIESILDLHWND